MRCLVSCFILLCWLGINLSADDAVPQFNRDIRPILSENCFPCHGQDSQTRKSDLRLDLRQSAVTAGAINPEAPTESSLLARIRSEDPEQRMPPPKSNRQLTPEQVQLLERWIQAGAEYQSHWSFVVPTRPPEPNVLQADWVRNPVDRFVLAKLESLKLAPSPEADRITLIRRLSLDLTGLPPTVDEVDAYLADQSSDAYEKVVDRLLNSKHFGERMAQPWLDAARYADTNGYQNDGERSMWRWRDWVIDAYNRNLPFDQFTIEQLAGDLLPAATQQQRLATGFASDSEGYRVYWKAGRVQLHLTKRWLDDALRVETDAAFPAEQWHHVSVVYDGSRMASGVKIYVNGQPQKLRVLLDQLNQSFQTKQPLRIGAGGGPQDRLQGLISDVRVYSRALSSDEIGIVATADNLAQLAAIAVAERTRFQANKLRECFLAEHAEPLLREARANVQRLQDERRELLDAMPTVMVMEEMPVPRETHVLIRGAYDRIGQRVIPGAPTSIAPFSASGRPNRLDFAKWLVSPANPLTARVAVNYQWQLIFGTGLVKTAEDFGSQGEPPSHPELLDWLACEFMQTAWDIKRLLKTVVTSATYRQTSRVTSELLERDPENRWLARHSRVRLPAEMIRDQALAVSGLLVDHIGGPSVKPYQPKGLWKDLSGTDYEPDHGDKLWRRSLYTFWKRTSPQPTMMSFDASAREMCRVRTSRTSTPLQALALMNDVTFVEAARSLAERVMSEGGESSSNRVSLAFRKVVARPPRAQELTLLLDNLNANLAKYRGDPEAALALISQGESSRDKRIANDELAAYTAIAGLILNLDEAITKP